MKGLGAVSFSGLKVLMGMSTLHFGSRITNDLGAKNRHLSSYQCSRLMRPCHPLIRLFV